MRNNETIDDGELCLTDAGLKFALAACYSYFVACSSLVHAADPPCSLLLL